MISSCVFVRCVGFFFSLNFSVSVCISLVMVNSQSQSCLFRHIRLFPFHHIFLLLKKWSITAVIIFFCVWLCFTFFLSPFQFCELLRMITCRTIGLMFYYSLCADVDDFVYDLLLMMLMMLLSFFFFLFVQKLFLFLTRETCLFMILYISPNALIHSFHRIYISVYRLNRQYEIQRK